MFPQQLLCRLQLVKILLCREYDAKKKQVIFNINSFLRYIWLCIVRNWHNAQTIRRNMPSTSTERTQYLLSFAERAELSLTITFWVIYVMRARKWQLVRLFPGIWRLQSIFLLPTAIWRAESHKQKELSFGSGQHLLLRHRDGEAGKREGA